MSEHEATATARTVAGATRSTTSRSTYLRRLLSAGPVLALAGLIILFAVLNPSFLSSGNLRAIIDQSAILLVVAIGSTFVILVGGIDLSIPGVMAASSLVTVLLASNDRNGNDLGLVAVLAGLATGALFGLVNGLLNTRVRIPSFMATLGVGAIGIGLATVLYDGSPPQLRDETMISLGIERTLGVSRLVFVAVAIAALCWFVQRYTRPGRYAYAIGGSEHTARLSGISIARYKTIAFVLSGTLAGLAGVMASAQLGVGSVAIGAGKEFAAITAVVVGGTLLQGGYGGVRQTVIGALIIAVLTNGMVVGGVNEYIQPAVQGAVIVAAITATSWNLRRRNRVVK